MISLKPLKEFKYPVIADCINPDIFKEKTLKEIMQLELWEGNKKRKLGELFKVEESKKEDSAETAITIIGDVSKVRMIGTGMTGGEIMIKGDVGMHLGEEMKGGKIIVHGSVGGWAGSMMTDGIIEVHGNTGDYLGAPYRGSTDGMKGGKIIVHGDAGNEAGAYMKGGFIKVYGNIGQFTGFRMRDGLIYVQKNCKGRAGACMKNGTIAICGFIKSVLPGFTYEGVKKKVKIEDNEVVESPFYLFTGDLSENGKGKLYVSRVSNPQLSLYERLV